MKTKTLILTGASGGIGRALALELSRAGVNLVLNARQAKPLVEVAQECEAWDVKICQMRGDASETHIAMQMVEEALNLGNFFGFIHAAGVLHPGPLLWELPPEHFREILDSHVTAGYELIRAAVPELLKEGKGVAVFFGSYAAVSNLTGIGAYNVAKAAEEHLARQLAAEAPQITSFVFRPGATETRMQEQAREAQGGGAEILQQVFRGYQRRRELYSPERVAKTLVRLLADNPRRYHGKKISATLTRKFYQGVLKLNRVHPC
jgi:NAD(P)-dependent dehydrogenase (short-subunit alcohol dehydrogenase family)